MLKLHFLSVTSSLKQSGKNLGHKDFEVFKRTKVQDEFPFSSNEEWPEFRRKRDQYESLLTAMAPVFSNQKKAIKCAFACFRIFWDVLSEPHHVGPVQLFPVMLLVLS